VYERQQDNDEWCAPNTGLGHHVRVLSSLANAYTMLYILFFLPFSPVSISTVTATQPVLSVTFATKEKAKRKGEREGEEEEMEREKKESKMALKLDDM
jgi:hypothetical protein